MLEELTFKVAEAPERSAALELRRRVYAEDVGHVPEEALDDRAHHLIARDRRGEVVAALQIVGSDQRPFDFERFVDLSAFLPPGRSPALIGRFCIRPDYRGARKSTFVQIAMLKLACAFARNHGFTDFVMYTFPHLLNFYRSGFFETVNVTFEHPGYRCRMHVMHLDLLGLRERCARSDRPTARLLLEPNPPNILI